ncbi:BEN domain-containing protein 2-like [Polyodon spathula]|uniref:BEN domain-containing protein 2-like n=1 Tax=Polyodon spathula TaxID=7913 RepID=UPI001B7F2D10|nr:BEN domain-containing protein 2-like [Polyodon spathula]
MVSEVPEEPVCSAIPGIVYEYQPKYDQQYGISGDYYSVDQQRTLGEILTYCQVMYDAIQKLDQKFDQLQAKVTNVQPVHLGPPLLKRKPVVPPSTGIHQVRIQVSPGGNAGLTMPQQIQTCPPFFQQQVGAEQPDIISPAPRVHRPSPVPPFQSPNQHGVHLHSIVSTDFTAPDPEPCHSFGEPSTDHLLEEADVKARCKTKQVDEPLRRSCTSPELIGDPGRNVTIPTNVLQKLSQKTNPRNTVRFLLRALFSIETLTCSNVMGDVGRGLSKLDPNKIAAMREWLVERFPSYDLREKGRDWRACISIINSAVRQMRFEARKLRKLQMNPTGQANPPGESPHSEIDEQRGGDRTEEQPLGMVEAAEICVELESDSEEEYSSLPVLESQELFGEESVEYLGDPMRGVRIAHSVMLAARQKRKPESAARFLIRHIFPDRVLLKSNVHGSKERGIPALDFSKISALREFLKEQFPEFKLNEDGYDWKVCVIAMNATIRRFRYDLQKFKRVARGDSR